MSSQRPKIKISPINPPVNVENICIMEMEDAVRPVVRIPVTLLGNKDVLCRLLEMCTKIVLLEAM